MATWAGSLRLRTSQERTGGFTVSLALADHICRASADVGLALPRALCDRLWKAEFRNFPQRFQQRQVEI